MKALQLLAILAFCWQAVVETSVAQAQTYTVLHRFKGGPTDGADPFFGPLIGDSAGNLYGTTFAGGAFNEGAVFKLNKAGVTILYSFTGGADGGNPEAGLIQDSAGNLYGTTFTGGTGTCAGCGVVFKLDPTGTETVLHTFEWGADGAGADAGLIRDAGGNFYGTTQRGGTFNEGVVFKVDTTETETVLYSFMDAGGANPEAGLVRDSAGNLYGTTFGGGPGGAGVVFKLDTTGTKTVLYSFTGGANGGNPQAGVIGDSEGNLYGTTSGGGSNDLGVVFKLDTTGKQTVLHSFTGGADGARPSGLIRDSSGNLYGTTYSGGILISGTGCSIGCGVVFKLDTTGTETVLHSFTGADGANPDAGLLRDSAGNLYGTTKNGGFLGSTCTFGSGAGCGVVFMIQP